MNQCDRTTRPRGRPRRGFTLIENLMAAVVLGVVVLAVGLAVSASQKASFEGQKAILASMAADDLMSELRAVAYDDLPLHAGLFQAVGEIVTLTGAAYPETYWPIGRRVSVADTQIQEEGLGAFVDGQLVTVTVFDEFRDIISLETFFLEPAS